MDGIILFTYSENEIEKISLLKQKLINNLSDELHSKKQSMNYIMKAKIEYYDCCDESDYNAAYYAAYMIDRETQSMLIKHETFLLEILDENKIEICKFNSVDDYMNNMAKTSTP